MNYDSHTVQAGRQAGRQAGGHGPMEDRPLCPQPHWPHTLTRTLQLLLLYLFRAVSWSPENEISSFNEWEADI